MPVPLGQVCKTWWSYLTSYGILLQVLNALATMRSDWQDVTRVRPRYGIDDGDRDEMEWPGVRGQPRPSHIRMFEAKALGAKAWLANLGSLRLF